MKSVNIAQLKNQLSLYLNEVRAGAEVLVCDRNVPIARIVPIGPDSGGDELRALAARGKIRLAERELDDSFWDLPAPRIPAEELRKAIERERDED
jgi:prevent-host-death family protein